jgi:hypothetical protein
MDFFLKRCKVWIAIFTLLFLVLAGGRQADCTRPFRISGYYLGATPEELGVKDDDFSLDEKFCETETNGVHLFFIRVRNRLRAYRIIKEEAARQENIKEILENLKARYGPPDKQQIKTSSDRPKYQMEFITTIKNRAIWNISAHQEFIAEIEDKKVVYELIDNNPENIEPAQKNDTPGGEEFSDENWNPDY